MTSAVLAPGYGGGADQPLLLAMAARLKEKGITAKRIAFSTARPSKDYEKEIAELAAATKGLRRPLALIGRSYGGRISAFLARENPPDALVVLGHPIRPPDKRRLRDEETLVALKCPTLIVQGDRDELGPLSVLRRLAKKNLNVELRVIRGAGHSYGSHEGEALDAATEWLTARLLP
jgi:uncharacterized protein